MNPTMSTLRLSLHRGGKPTIAAGIAPIRRPRPVSTGPNAMTVAATEDMTAPKAAFRQFQATFLIGSSSSVLPAPSALAVTRPGHPNRSACGGGGGAACFLRALADVAGRRATAGPPP